MENDLLNFNFDDFRLLSVHFDAKTDREFRLTKEIQFETSLHLNHDFLPDKKVLRLFMKVEVWGDKLPFSISVEAGGMFSFPDYRGDTPSKDLDKTARIGCAAMAFPYVREAMADIVRRSGFPPLNLPPVNFIDFYRQHKEGRAQGPEKDYH